MLLRKMANATSNEVLDDRVRNDVRLGVMLEVGVNDHVDDDGLLDDVVRSGVDVSVAVSQSDHAHLSATEWCVQSRCCNRVS